MFVIFGREIVRNNRVVLPFWYKIHSISVHWQMLEFGVRRKSRNFLLVHVTDFSRIESSF